MRGVQFYPRIVISITLLLFAAILTDGCKDDEEPVKKDEGVYINEVYASSGEDWLELYNSNEQAKDLTGYSVSDDNTKYELPSGTSIPAKGYLVIFCDDTGSGLHTNFKLSSTGETITLENAGGDLVDRIMFPVLQDGEVYARFPDGSTSIGVSGIATQGTANGESQASLIQNVTREPLVPAPGNDVVVSATVLSNSGTPTVRLHYRVDGGTFVELPMAGNQTFTATIPALNTTGLVEYYITAASAGNTTYYPFGAPAVTESYLINTDPLPALRINEFMALNTACCPDTSGEVEEFDDWIEIYNAGSATVDLAGMYLSDDSDNPFKFRFPDDDPDATTIAPGEFVLVWADEEGSQGSLHANFQLAGDGEDVALFYIDGRTIDAYSYTPQQENKSAGLTPDGEGTFEFLVNPSPGTSNN